MLAHDPNTLTHEIIAVSKSQDYPPRRRSQINLSYSLTGKVRCMIKTYPIIPWIGDKHRVV